MSLLFVCTQPCRKKATGDWSYNSCALWLLKSLLLPLQRLTHQNRFIRLKCNCWNFWRFRIFFCLMSTRYDHCSVMQGMSCIIVMLTVTFILYSSFKCLLMFLILLLLLLLLIMTIIIIFIVFDQSLISLT